MRSTKPGQPEPPVAWGDAIAVIRGVGSARARELARVGIGTVGDLLLRLPLRYEDRSRPLPVADLRPGERQTVCGRLVRCGFLRTRRPGFTLFEAVLRDETGSVAAVWFNQRYLRDVFAVGQTVVLFGPVGARPDGTLQLTNPHFEIVASLSEEGGHQSLDLGRIVPIYERVGPVTAKLQRRLVHDALRRLDVDGDDLPGTLRARLGLPDRVAALRTVHFPPEGSDVAALNARETPAQRRLVFEEFFEFQLGVAARRAAARAVAKPFAITITDRIREVVRSVLPFRLTPAQKDALRGIVADMQRPQPMNRLLQGDVGAGKTVVALAAAVVALENGLQVVLMVPTAVLADQHRRTFSRWLAATSHRVDTLTAATPADDRRRLLADLRAGAPRLVIGTHALVEDGVAFGRLGLAIIDEQHRFGVMHRAAFTRADHRPDVLVMTATPIPRTMALTVYGDLDISVIRGRPPGRRPVVTIAEPDERRDVAYAMVRRRLEAGEQAYVVYPVVDPSARLDLRAATVMADHLAQEVFPEFRVGLVHGRLAPAARDRVMGAFADGNLHVLVATSVVEVGLDVPAATIMVVEHAERFGLAQLHQLRGRVGRGDRGGTCVLLFQPPLGDEARERLRVLVSCDDGFAIAERDLELRGPGDVFGTRQAGLPRLRVGDPVRDRALMELARTEARAWVDAHGLEDPTVRRAVTGWADRFGLGSVA